ncbi:MAG: hypothetical protein ABI377_11545 [Devosia sp.]
MLRNAVIVFGAILFAIGIIGTVWVGPAALVYAVMGALLLAGTLYERIRYKPIEPVAPGPGWEVTGERFVDNETGKLVTVYIQRRTGERKYVSG